MTARVLLSFLERVRAERRIGEVFRGALGNATLRGFVLGASSEVIVLHRIDEVGRDEGLTAIRTADVTRISAGHLEKREALACNVEARVEPTSDVLLSMATCLMLWSREHGHVAVWAEAEDQTFVIGRGLAVDDDHVELEVRSPLSSLHRTCLAVRELTRIDADGPFERLAV